MPPDIDATWPPCAAQYFGSWLIEERWFSGMVQAYRDGTLKPRLLDPEPQEPEFRRGEKELFIRGPNGMAIIAIRDFLMKGDSKFGGTSTLKVRRALRSAALDETVSAIMLFIDSPGGTADGTFELAAEVLRTREEKPVRAHIEDLGASAAFWVASQAERVTANTMGMVGSIGTVALLVDSSQAAEAEGLKVHVISTGEFKGAGAPGTVVTDRQLAVFQEEVDDLNAHFLEGVSRGRGLTGEALARVATGRTWIAEKARALGLIDAVAPWEEVVGEFAAGFGREATDASRMAIAIAETELRLGPES